MCNGKNLEHQADETKSACMELLSSFVDKNFVLHHYSSLIVQEVEISREHMKIGRTGGFLLSPRSLNGVALVQLSQHRWYLVMTRIFFGSDETSLRHGY